MYAPSAEAQLHTWTTHPTHNTHACICAHATMHHTDPRLCCGAAADSGFADAADVAHPAVTDQQNIDRISRGGALCLQLCTLGRAPSSRRLGQ